MSYEVEARPKRQPIHPGTMFVLVIAFLSFIVPIVPAIVSIIAGFPVKYRLRRQGGDRMNEGLTTIGQLSGLFTLVLWGAFLWYARWKWGN